MGDTPAKTSRATRLNREAKAKAARELFRMRAPLKVTVLDAMLDNFDAEDRAAATIRYYNGSIIVEVPADAGEPEVPLQ